MTFKTFKNKQTGEEVEAELQPNGDCGPWYAIHKDFYITSQGMKTYRKGNHMLYNNFHEQYKEVKPNDKAK